MAQDQQPMPGVQPSPSAQAQPQPQPQARPTPPVQPPAAPPVKSRSDSGSGFLKGCLVAALVVGVVGVLGLAGLIVLAVAGSASTATSTARSGLIDLQEVSVGGVKGGPKVACISVEGFIYGAATPGAELTLVSLVCAQLDRAQADAKVRGVILYVDSPGGGITASDILHHKIKEFRTASGGKPVVVCMMDTAASGAYYISAPTDWIIAHPTSVTGSIGVLMPLYDATGLMSKIGVKSESITAGEFKNIGSPFEEKTEEQREEERAILRDIIVQMHEQFVGVVAEGRKMDVEKARAIADGRIFSSRQALELGLIDEIGYESDAVAAVRRIAGIGEPELIQYRRVVTFADMVAAFAAGPNLTVQVKGDMPALMQARPQFLWTPSGGGQDARPAAQ